MRNPKEIGEIFKEAREKKSIAIEKVYKVTHIQPKIIEAFEQGKADEVLGRVYILLFVRKYATFLGLDSSSLVADYKAFYADEKKKQVPDAATVQPAINIDVRKWVTLSIFVLTLSLFIFFALILGVKMKSFYAAKKARLTAAVPQKTVPKYPAKDKTQAVFPIPEDKTIELILQSTDEIWMKIKGDGKAIFEGTMRKNEKRTLSATSSIDLWLGRAEAVEVTINGYSLGKLGKGNIKNIRVSRSGIKIGNKRLIGAKE
ncbi:MAG: hypothetical protein A2Y81_08790 [Nitrospirae bacterium RBG_13_43_8]|nr:MAG: hypothetical protein A2Y81_08790 [Nitrospirae bacterium RBG_13_43_8]